MAWQLLLAGLSVPALADLGVSYDHFPKPSFSGVNPSPYEQVLVAMDGGGIEAPSMANGAAIVSAGHYLAAGLPASCDFATLGAAYRYIPLRRPHVLDSTGEEGSHGLGVQLGHEGW